MSRCAEGGVGNESGKNIRELDIAWVNLPNHSQICRSGGPRNAGEYRNRPQYPGDPEGKCPAWLVWLDLGRVRDQQLERVLLAMPTSSTIRYREYRVPSDVADMFDRVNQCRPGNPCDVLCNEWAALPSSFISTDSKGCYLASLVSAVKRAEILARVDMLVEDGVELFDHDARQYRSRPDGWVANDR